jgi:hypothetical protein
MSLSVPRQGKSLEFHVYPNWGDAGTLGDVETILWSSIDQLRSRSAAEWVARYRHGQKNKAERRWIAKNVKVYIQQASEFYASAKAAKSNTAPLIYYYSFLNLAKALCEFRQPGFHLRTECYGHGLSWRPDRYSVVVPGREAVTIIGRGVWHSLWEAVTRQTCKARQGTRLKIPELFRYCPEVGLEVGRSLGGETKLLDLEQVQVMYDEKLDEAWLKFSVSLYSMRNFGLTAKSLSALIGSGRTGYVEVKREKKEWRTFESVIPVIRKRRENVWQALREDILALHVISHLAREKKLAFCLPLQKQLAIRMPQMLILYTILFWLGALVRYDPHSVATLMDSPHWVLIDGFMSQSRLWLLEQFEWELYQAETTLWVTR